MADGQDQVLCDSGERFRALLERYKLALAAGRTTVWEWDAATNTISTDEHILSEMLGFAVREGYTVTDWMTAVHPEDRDRVRAEWAAFIEGPADTAESEYRVVSDDGRVWWQHTRYVVSARENGRARRIVGVTADVTERKQAEEAQRLSEERYRAFFELNMVGAGEVDLAEGRILRVNDAYCRMLGYSRDELLGRRFLEVTHPDDREEDLQQYQRLVRGEIASYEMEKRYICKDGNLIWGRLAVTLIRDSDGNPVSELGLVLDVTESKTVQQELERLTARLLHVQDEERRRISQGLHDQSAQALVASNLNIASCLRAHPDLDQDVIARLGESLALGERVLGEIRTLAYVLHPPLLEELGLQSALAWLVDGFRRRSGIAMELHVPEGIGRLAPEVEIALYRVVQESLQNILQHSGSTRGSIRLARKDTSIILEVEDHGHGIETESSGASEHVEARGVGIADMRQRLRQLGGQLDVHSGPTGTTITAAVPWEGALLDGERGPAPARRRERRSRG